jgi:hypothetical protein
MARLVPRFVRERAGYTFRVAKAGLRWATDFSDGVLRIVGLLALVLGVIIAGVLNGLPKWAIAVAVGVFLLVAIFEGAFRVWREAEARAEPPTGNGPSTAEKLDDLLARGTMLRIQVGEVTIPNPAMLRTLREWRAEVIDALAAAGLKRDLALFQALPPAPEVLAQETIQEIGRVGEGLNLQVTGLKQFIENLDGAGLS